MFHLKKTGCQAEIDQINEELKQICEIGLLGHKQSSNSS